MEKIIIRGAKVHNLKNIDVEIPRNCLVVITGLSGSNQLRLTRKLIHLPFCSSSSPSATPPSRTFPKPETNSTVPRISTSGPVRARHSTS